MLRIEQSAFLKVLEPYMRAFTERDVVRRQDLLRESMTETAEIYGPKVPFTGYEQISVKIDWFQTSWPECRLVMASGLNVYHDSARFACAIVNSDGELKAQGHAVVQLSSDGRVAKVLPYWDTLPPVPGGWPLELTGGEAQRAAQPLIRGEAQR